ncbi:MAG TPA: hypothetical protein VF812_12425 [Ktedonobacterales bacterium]
MAAAQTLILERDTVLRETLREALREEGYTSAGVDDIEQARATLRVSPNPLVVLIGHGDPRVNPHSLVEEAGNLPPHAYLILSTNPEQAPHVRNPHTGRIAPVVSTPCDIQTLITQVNKAARRLAWALYSAKRAPAKAAALR